MLNAINNLNDDSTAMIAVLDKWNSPIVIKNYLVDNQESDSKSLIILKSQMELLVYQCLDLLTEQYARIKTKQETEA